MTEEQIRVLVTDDEKSIRDLLERVLKEASYDVVTAADGQETLDKMSQLKFEAVLLDIKMPGMSGIDVLQRIITSYHETCVVMVTAVTEAQSAVEAMKLGAYDYIVKPFNWDELVPKLKGAIEKKRLELQNERRQFELQKRVGEQAQRLQEQFADLVQT